MKKRKQVSEAEKASTEIWKLVCDLYKLVPRHAQERFIKFENKRVVFTKSKQHNLDAEACNLSDNRQRPCYCARAEFKFEASLPDRAHLTRFSVRTYFLMVVGISHCFTIVIAGILCKLLLERRSRIPPVLFTLRRNFYRFHSLARR